MTVGGLGGTGPTRNTWRMEHGSAVLIELRWEGAACGREFPWVQDRHFSDQGLASTGAQKSLLSG